MDLLAYCILTFCLHQFPSAVVPGKTDFDFADTATGEILLVRWIDPEHTLNVTNEDCWIYDGAEQTPCYAEPR